MSRVAKRYARALFSAVLEEKKAVTVTADLRLVEDLTREHAGFATLLVNPLIGSERQIRIIEEIFSGRVETLTLNFLKLVAEKKRLDFLPEIIVYFQQLLRDYNNEITVDVISATPLTEVQLNAIKDQVAVMTGKKIILRTASDPSLIGGFQIKIEDIIIDNSMRYQLYKLREHMVA